MGRVQPAEQDTEGPGATWARSSQAGPVAPRKRSLGQRIKRDPERGKSPPILGSTPGLPTEEQVEELRPLSWAPGSARTLICGAAPWMPTSQGGQAGQGGATAPACLPGRLPDGGTWSRAVPSVSPHPDLPE